MSDEPGVARTSKSAPAPAVPWDTSVAGDKAPPDAYALEIADIVSGGLGGRFNTETWKFEIPSGLRASDMNRVMNGLGALKFYANLLHGIRGLPFLFGSHWEIKYKNNWYHFVFSGGTIRDLRLLEWHYEKFQPSSWKHWIDWKNTRGRTSGY
jgi:hypothetical protein